MIDLTYGIPRPDDIEHRHIDTRLLQCDSSRFLHQGGVHSDLETGETVLYTADDRQEGGILHFIAVVRSATE